MENIKYSFFKVKEDISSLQNELSALKNEFFHLNNQLLDFSKILENFYTEMNGLKSSHNQIISYLDTLTKDKTERDQRQTDRQTISTDQTHFKPLNHQNQGISTRNEGVSTDRQTNRQTNRQAGISEYSPHPENYPKEREIGDANEIIKTLSNIQDDLKKKFKNLTNQEMLVFSSIYQLEEEQGFSDYKILSSSLNLSESSIRDYVGRLIKKGIPLEKEKINNKGIKLKISPNFKKIASLSSILKLRDV